jgi:ankyrin repeat protein
MNFSSALGSGDVGEVKRLLDRGVDVETRGLQGMTALMVAAKDGRRGRH